MAHPLRSGVPVLMIDIKGDLPNLLLGFPSFSYRPLLPWARACARPGDTRSDEELAAAHPVLPNNSKWATNRPPIAAG